MSRTGDPFRQPREIASQVFCRPKILTINNFFSSSTICFENSKISSHAPLDESPPYSKMIKK